MFTIRIDTANAAFEDDPAPEIARILRRVADEVAEYYPGHSQTLLDVNGNDVGRAKITR